MCGACGRAVASPTTARLNASGLKRRALARLRAGLAPGCRLSREGGGGPRPRRSGRGESHVDVEPLLVSLEGAASGEWRGEASPREVLARVLRESG